MSTMHPPLVLMFELEHLRRAQLEAFNREPDTLEMTVNPALLDPELMAAFAAFARQWYGWSICGMPRLTFPERPVDEKRVAAVIESTVDLDGMGSRSSGSIVHTRIALDLATLRMLVEDWTPTAGDDTLPAPMIESWVSHPRPW